MGLHARGIRHSGDACRAASVDGSAGDLCAERFSRRGRRGPGAGHSGRDDSSAQLAGRGDELTAADSAFALGCHGTVRVGHDERCGPSGGPCADAADLARAVDASGA